MVLTRQSHAADKRRRAGLRLWGVLAVALAAVLVGLATSGRAASTPQFTIRNLGTLGLDSYSVALNDHGQVTGYSYTASAVEAFSWTKTEGMIELGNLGGTYTAPTAINNNGQIVGESQTPTGLRAFLWSKAGGIVNLGGSRAWDINANGVTVGDDYGDGRGFIWRPGSGMAPVGDVSNSPRAINDSDQVIGFAGSGGFSWTQASGMTYLHLPGDFGSSARALNNLGIVVGFASTDQGGKAFVWSSTSGMHDLGAGQCGGREAVAVSDSGYVAGNGRTASCDVHAWVWTDTTGMLDLGTLGGSFSQATDVNESGQVVGFSTTATGSTHAFSWTPSDGMTDLGTLAGSYSRAWAVNELGQVAGESQTATGGTHAVLWEPADTTPPVITVPADITVNATSPAGAVVEYNVTATDDTDPEPDMACTPPSGSVFPVGVTTVTCHATDNAGNIGTASLTVTVRGGAEQLAALLDEVQGVGPGTSFADKVMAAQAAYTAGDVTRACEILNAFINQVQAQTGRSITNLATADTLIADATRIRAVLGC